MKLYLEFVTFDIIKKKNQTYKNPERIHMGWKKAMNLFKIKKDCLIGDDPPFEWFINFSHYVKIFESSFRKKFKTQKFEIQGKLLSAIFRLFFKNSKKN